MKTLSNNNKFFRYSEKTFEREISALDTIKDHNPKYLITLDYDRADYNGIKQISAIDFLLGRVEI